MAYITASRYHKKMFAINICFQIQNTTTSTLKQTVHSLALCCKQTGSNMVMYQNIISGSNVMPNTHRRRVANIELSCVGGVYWA